MCDQSGGVGVSQYRTLHWRWGVVGVPSQYRPNVLNNHLLMLMRTVLAKIARHTCTLRKVQCQAIDHWVKACNGNKAIFNIFDCHTALCDQAVGHE